MISVGVRTIGNIREVLLSRDSKNIEVFVEGNEIKILDNKTLVATEHVPAPIVWVKDADGKPIVFPEDEPLPAKFPLPFYEVAINPTMPLVDATNACRAFGGGLDGIRGHMMELSKAQLLYEERKADREAMDGVDWAIRVYREYARVLPADGSLPDDPDDESEDAPRHATVGCVVYHYVGMIAGKNVRSGEQDGTEKADAGVPEQEVSKP